MYKVFVYNSVLLLSEKPASKNFFYSVDESFKYENGRQLSKTIRKLAKAKQGKVINIFGKEEQFIWKAFLQKFKLVSAGGGIVVNEINNKILMIKRRGYWDIPKGKSEKGETIEQTAIREVSEECGIKDLKLGPFICHTYHLFGGTRSRKIKKTTWFAMRSRQNTLSPQAEEDITKARWLTTKETEKKLKKAYRSITEVFSKFWKM